jgi:hypothetical protein
MSNSNVKMRILRRLNTAAQLGVWTPVDFLDIGKRDAVDKVLQRLSQNYEIQRIDRGLYYKPRLNPLTGKPTAPDYRKIIDALARRDQTRMLIDGLTAANDLGLTDAVPAHVVVHTDARLKPLRLGKLNLCFKQTAPSKLYWAGRPAMKVVQALHWLRDTLPRDKQRIIHQLQNIISDPQHGKGIRDDLQAGLPTLPGWMQEIVREVLQPAPSAARPSPDDDVSQVSLKL